MNLLAVKKKISPNPSLVCSGHTGNHGRSQEQYFLGDKELSIGETYRESAEKIVRKG